MTQIQSTIDGNLFGEAGYKVYDKHFTIAAISIEIADYCLENNNLRPEVLVKVDNKTENISDRIHGIIDEVEKQAIDDLEGEQELWDSYYANLI